MASILLGQYDPSKVSIIMDGIEVYGFPDGEMVIVERTSPTSNNLIGTRGEVSRAIIRDNTGTITLRLQSTAPIVRTIESWKVAENAFTIAGISVPPIINFAIVDPATAAKIVATQCWLQEWPTYSWGNEVTVLEYKFFAINISTGPNTALAVGSNIAALGTTLF